jgi:drug/metabolite transporter (DMT)-like permease
MKQFRFTGIACLMVTVLLFSTFEVVSKGLLDRVDAFQINFWRFLFGGLLLLLICAARGDLRFDLRDAGKLVLSGFIGITLSMSLLQYSLCLVNAKASVVALMFSTNPIFVLVFQSIREKTKPKAIQLLGLLICVIGVCLLFAEDLIRGVGNPMVLLLALGASVFYGLYTVLGHDLAVKYGSLKYNSYSFLAGAALMLPVLAVQNLALLPTDPSTFPTLAYLAFLVTGVAYWTYFIGLKRVGAGKGSLVFFLKPPLAVVFAWWVLGEQPGISLLAGLLLVLAGLWLVNRRAAGGAAPKPMETPR